MPTAKGKQATSRSFAWKLAIIIPAILGSGLVGGYYFTRDPLERASHAALSKSTQQARLRPIKKAETWGAHERWISLRPILADVDADGRNELLSIVHDSERGRYSIQCLNIPDGSKRWSWDFGEYESQRLHPAIVWLPKQELLLLSDRSDNTIRALDPRTGATRWESRSAETMIIEGIAKETLFLVGFVRGKMAIRIENGEQISPVPAKPKQWTYASSDQEENFQSPGSFLDEPRPAFEGLDEPVVYCPHDRLEVSPGEQGEPLHRCADPRGIAFAQPKDGPKIPYLLRYDRESTQEHWRTALIDADAFEEAIYPDDYAYAPSLEKAEFLFVAYRIGDTPELHLARIALANGARKLFATYDTGKDYQAYGLSADAHYLYLRVGGALLLIDPEEGKVLKQLGAFSDGE